MALRQPGECPRWIMDWGGGQLELPTGEVRVIHHERHQGPERESRALAYLRKVAPCVQGQGGSGQAYAVACCLTKGYQLAPEIALGVVMMEYNHRCQPPWSESEWQHHLKRASERGSYKDLLAEEPPGKAVSAPREAKLLTSLKKKETQEELEDETFDQVELKQVSWLWPGYLPQGMLVMLDGDPGLGKSTLLLDIASRVSRCGLMPFGKEGVTGRVLIMSGEDPKEYVIKPRLIAAEAEQSLIHRLGLIRSKDGETARHLSFPEDVQQLKGYLSRPRDPPIRLVIVDPFMSYLGKVDSHKDQDVRRALTPLAELAERFGVTVVCLRHLTKGGGGNALYRGSSSIAIAAAARVVLLVGRHPDNDKNRVLAMVKNNVGPMMPSLEWGLWPTPIGACRVDWVGECDLEADDLLQTRTHEEQEQKNQREQAKELLKELLKNGSVPVLNCIREGESKEYGISARTMRRAAKELGVIVIRKDPAWQGAGSWRLSSGATNGQTGGPQGEAIQGQDGEHL